MRYKRVIPEQMPKSQKKNLRMSSREEPVSTSETEKVVEKKDEAEKKIAKKLILVRNGVGIDVSANFLKVNSLYLDSDIYEQEGEVTRPINRHQDRLITERDFSLHTPGGGVDVEMLNRYLVQYGKIPAFLCLEKREEICVVARERIAKDQILGTFQGVFRQEMQTPFSRPLYDSNDQQIGFLDADNLLFGNWSRFLRGRKTSTNLKLISYNYTILIFTTAEVRPGEELCELVPS
jgi:hypothetical protein